MSQTTTTPWTDLVAQAAEQIDDDINNESPRFYRLMGYRMDYSSGVVRRTRITLREKFLVKFPFSFVGFAIPVVAIIVTLSAGGREPGPGNWPEIIGVLALLGVSGGGGAWFSDKLVDYRFKRRIELTWGGVPELLMYSWRLREETYDFIKDAAKKGNVTASRMKVTLDATLESIEDLYLEHQGLRHRLRLAGTREAPQARENIRAALADIERLLAEITAQYQAAAWHLSAELDQDAATAGRDSLLEVSLTDTFELIESATDKFNAAARSLRAQMN